MDYGCEGCKHNIHIEEQYCYMFENKPEKTPCAQHDMFSDIRKETAEKIRNNPMYIFEFLEELKRS